MQEWMRKRVENLPKSTPVSARQTVEDLTRHIENLESRLARAGELLGSKVGGEVRVLGRPLYHVNVATLVSQARKGGGRDKDAAVRQLERAVRELAGLLLHGDDLSSSMDYVEFGAGTGMGWDHIRGVMSREHAEALKRLDLAIQAALTGAVLHGYAAGSDLISRLASGGVSIDELNAQTIAGT